MKLFCRVCGCHFPADFEVSLKSPCNFWGDRGLGGITLESKQKLWDWAFSMPSDEIFIRDSIGLTFSFDGVPVDKTFESMVPGWEKMTEEQRQDYERKYFKKALNGDKNPVVLPDEKKEPLLN